jgi:predicted small lipoprotein YifL
MLTKLKHAALLVAVAASLTACDEESPVMVDPLATAADQADIDAQTRTQLNKDDAELKEELAKLQAKDPSVKDLYYSIDANGNKQLHIAREVPDQQNPTVIVMQDSVTPMAQGMLLNMMMMNMMMHPMMYPMHVGVYPMGAYRMQRNVAMSGYSSYTRTTTSRSFVSSRPSSSFSTRSSGAFSSSSSARSGSYSSGG